MADLLLDLLPDFLFARLNLLDGPLLSSLELLLEVLNDLVVLLREQLAPRSPDLDLALHVVLQGVNSSTAANLELAVLLEVGVEGGLAVLHLGVLFLEQVVLYLQLAGLQSFVLLQGQLQALHVFLQ